MGGMNTTQGAGTQSGGSFPTVQYTAANAPPDPTTVPLPQSRPQIDATSVDENKKPDEKTADATNVAEVNPGDYKNEIEYDKDGLPIRRKKGN